MKAEVGVGDLVRLFAALPPEQHDRAAGWFGLARRGAALVAMETLSEPVRTATGTSEPAPSEAPATSSEATDNAPMTFWRMEAEERFDDAAKADARVGDGRETSEGEIPTERLTDEDLHDRTRSIFATPPTPPLSPWSRLWPRLHEALHASFEGRDPDVDTLVRWWGRGEVPRRLPRVRRKTWPGRVALWVDRSARLQPFWHDQSAVYRHLRARCGPANVLLHRLDDASEAPVFRRGGVPAGAACDASVPVLLLGDLGAYGNDRDRALWSAAGRRLDARGTRRVALAPCSRARMAATSAQVWSAMPWEPRRCDETGSTRAERAVALLRLMAPAALVQPGMLRALRRLLPARRADASTEADVWRHPDVRAQDASGIVLHDDAAERWRARFAHDPDLGDGTRSAVCDILAAWHARAPMELRHAETLAWHAWLKQRDLRPPGKLDEALHFGRKLEGNLVAGAVLGAATWDEQRYGRALLGAVPDEVYVELPSLGRVWRESHRHVAHARVPTTLSPRALASGERGEARTVAVRLVGDALVLTVVEGSAWPSVSREAGSPVALLEGVREHVWVRLRDDATWWQRKFARELRVPLPDGDVLTLAGAAGSVTLRRWAREPWAKAAGCDGFGLWAEFVVGKVRQRMRWVPPGTFTMGAPKGEGYQYRDETPHRVTLTEGCWLGETPVTQALWQAVMGDNPSRFKGAQRPVECVSWDDSTRFLAKLNVAVPGLGARLPTEAQWERACRGSTEGATWLGSVDATRLDRIAWFADNSGGQTHDVGGKEPNPYGLHDMLGNVWEWCSDWYAAHERAHAVDPTGVLTGSKRVMRGGSWVSVAGLVRAALRAAIEPGFRLASLGFRVSRGQESALKSGHGAERMERRGAGRDTERASPRDADEPKTGTVRPKGGRGRA